LATTIADGTGRGGAGDDIISGAGLKFLAVNQSVTYTSPSISGVSLSYLTTMATGAGTTSYTLNYSTGGLKAAYASATTASKTDTLTAASYDFGAATAHYGYGTAESTTTNKKVNTIGVTVPFGALSIHYGMQKGDTTTTKSMLSYAMSKRTTAYVLYADDGGAASATATTTYVGLKHAF
jgi:hypothetical protein